MIDGNGVYNPKGHFQLCSIHKSGRTVIHAIWNGTWQEANTAAYAISRRMHYDNYFLHELTYLRRYAEVNDAEG